MKAEAIFADLLSPVKRVVRLVGASVLCRISWRLLPSLLDLVFNLVGALFECGANYVRRLEKLRWNTVVLQTSKALASASPTARRRKIHWPLLCLFGQEA